MKQCFAVTTTPHPQGLGGGEEAADANSKREKAIPPISQGAIEETQWKKQHNVFGKREARAADAKYENWGRK